MTEVHEGRYYSEFTDRCDYCENKAVWTVEYGEYDSTEYMQVCEKHKYTAFS